MIKILELNKIYNGNCLDILKQLPSESIDMCVTSPPYWNLRDYGCSEQIGNEIHYSEYI
jgi:DNA modification methylase